MPTRGELVAILNVVGSLASVIGIPIALISIWQAWKAARRSATKAELSRAASERAVQEVHRFREDLRLITSVIDFERALGLMDDIKSFLRHSTYQPVPDRIATLVTLLNKLRSASPSLDDRQRALIQQSVATLRRIEHAIDRADLSAEQPKEAPDFSRRISDQIDSLQPLLTALRDQIGAGGRT